MRTFMASISTICLCSICIGCSQESLIFYPELLPPDYKFVFSEPFEEVTILVDGATLHALLFSVKDSKGVVLYLHGNAGNLSTWGDVTTDFTSRGYNILIPDYRGYGKSTGKITSEKQLLDDGLAVYRWLTKTWQENKIIVYGRSIGTGIATFLASSEKPRILIMESPFLSFIDLASYHYPFLPRSILSMFLRYTLRNDLRMGGISCPVYLFHGTKDKIVPFDHSVRLEKLIRTSHELIQIDGGGHNDLCDFGAFARALDKVLQ